MSSLVSWRDYEGVEGFYGASSAQDMSQLRKALLAGSEQNPPGSAVAGDGFALRVESLERTLKNTTFRMEHVRLWRGLPKIPAYNTVEEYNQIQSYGAGSGAWISEGALPNETDATYERKFALIKFMGTMRRVSHVMSLVRPAHGNVIAQETIAGTMFLLKEIERSLFDGRSDLDAVQWDGFEKLIEDGVVGTSGNVIDLRGQPLSEDVLVDAALTIMDAPNYGMPTHLHLNPKVKADLVKTFFPKARYDIGRSDLGMIGTDIKGFTSPAGDVKFEPNTFIDDGGGLPAAAEGSASARPGTPTISTALTSPVNAASQFAAADVGTYFWHIVAVNRYGASAEVTALSTAVALGDDARFGVTPGPGPLPSYYKVYRTEVGGATATARRILRVANTVGGGETTIIDTNSRLPGCSTAYMFQQNIENMAFKQLAPMIKIPLSTVDPSIRWMQLLYGTPILYTPRHNVIFRNVGRAVDYVGAP